ncbi:MAG: M50 family metallopeptidase, partial [Bacilli bacterium]
LFWLVLVGSVAVGQFIEIISLFAIVMIHEIGHFAAAKYFGWRVTEIQILPFGGVAKVEENGNVPVKEEIIVALAGPLQNGLMIVIAFLFFRVGIWSAEWSTFFIHANVTLALFNLLPIYPLDGGKVVQCLMSLWMNYRVAIDRSLQWSIFISFILLIASLGPGPLPIQLQLAGMSIFFIWTSWVALKHAHYQFLRFLIGRHRGVKNKRRQIAFPLIVSPAMKIIDVAMMLYRDRYHVIYITETNGDIREVIPEEKLLSFYFEYKMPGSAIGQLLS